MAKKPGPGPCVHCLKIVEHRNWDHVFPRSWYPDTTPSDVEKWKVPTCRPCNDEYGRIEHELLTTLSMCVDPKTSESSGIYGKALRSLDPSQGKTDKDRRAREEKKQQILSQILTGDEIPKEGIYPGLGERWDRPRAEQSALFVPAKSLQRLVEKIVRGIVFIEDQRLIDERMEIEHHVVNEAGSKEIEDALARFGVVHSRGPGIQVARAVTPEDGVSALYKITVWGQFVMYASVMPRLA